MLFSNSKEVNLRRNLRNQSCQKRVLKHRNSTTLQNHLEKRVLKLRKQILLQSSLLKRVIKLQENVEEAKNNQNKVNVSIREKLRLCLREKEKGC